MCFHNSMSKKAKEVAARYGRKSDIIEIVQDIINEQYHSNAFTNPVYPVITTSDEVQAFNWGLIPFWTKSDESANDIRRMTYNAKAETIFEKPSFRNPILSKRCLVPSTGYFEWRHEGSSKIPYYIYLKDEEIFSMAGVYDIWDNPQNEELLYTFSIITTTANPLTAYIHNTKQRMPVILSREDEEKWLDRKLSKTEIQSFLKPFDENKMDAYIVDKDFPKRNPHDRTILDRAG